MDIGQLQAKQISINVSKILKECVIKFFGKNIGIIAFCNNIFALPLKETNLFLLVKKNCLLVVLLLGSFFCHAQRSEVGALIGTSFYLGDLNNIPFRSSKFAGGLIYRYNFTPRIALKANALFGTLEASDEKNHSFRKDSNDNYLWNYRDRKLSFTSPITEISAQLEINFFNVYNERYRNQISPYLFGGIAFFSFDPKAVYNDTLFHLQPMGTEGQERGGQGKKYSLTGFAIPFGIGFKANIGRYVCVGAEWGLRFTFTKYLDDVGDVYFIDSTASKVVQYFADPSAMHKTDQQRCSTIKNDWYSFAGIVITIRIGNEDRICDIKTHVKLKSKRGPKR